MTNLNKLTETFNKFLETQIEYADEVAAIKEGTYEGDMVGEIVLNNLDEFTEDELVRVLENYDYYNNQGGHILFPSNYEVARGPYPVKLAEALAKSKEAETLTDLFNIFYRHRADLKTWGEAAEVWQVDILENQKATQKLLDEAGISDEEDEHYVYDMIDTIGEAFPLFAKAFEKIFLKYKN
jgi:hypothetical protein